MHIEKSSKIAAWGVPCEFDDLTDKPLLGTISLNLNALKGKSLDDQMATVVHEMAHIFGFSKTDFQYWRDRNGVKHEEPVKQTQHRGKDVMILSTPNVIKHARKYFNCTTLEGVELESQGTKGTEGSHWEKFVMKNDFMVADMMIRDVAFTEITVAAFEDSGWYQVDYDYAISTTWARNQG